MNDDTIDTEIVCGYCCDVVEDDGWECEPCGAVMCSDACSFWHEHDCEGTP